MHPIDKAARVAGALYLLAILVGPFSLIDIPTVLFVSGDATATAHNILTDEMLFRVGIVGDLLAGVSILFLTLALYQLLKGVDRSYAVLMVILGGLMVTPIFFLNALNWVAALLLVHGADFLAAFTQSQRYSLAMLFIATQPGQRCQRGVLGPLAVPIWHAGRTVALPTASAGHLADRGWCRLSRAEPRGIAVPAVRGHCIYRRPAGVPRRVSDHVMASDRRGANVRALAASAPVAFVKKRDDGSRHSASIR